MADAWFAGRWGDAERLAAEFLDETEETGVPHYMEHGVRAFLALIAAAEGDFARALDEAGTSLRIAQGVRDPQAVVPAVIFGAFIGVLAGDEAGARERVGEAFERDERGAFVPWCGASSLWLADRLALGAELEAPVLRSTVRGGWLAAARAYLAGDLPGAADVYAEIGSLPDEAWTRLMAAEQLVEAGRPAEAEQHVHKALAFCRSVDAKGFARRAEALLRASA